MSGVERVEARGGWTGWEGGMLDVEIWPCSETARFSHVSRAEVVVYIVHEASMVHLQVLNNVGFDESGGPRSIRSRGPEVLASD